MHKMIAPKENIPGHISINGWVEISAIIIKISTVRSQNTTKIPPNMVVFPDLAIAPSNVSMKKDNTIKIVEMNINIISCNIPLRKMKKAQKIPISSPIKVSWLAVIFPISLLPTNFSNFPLNLDLENQLSIIKIEYISFLKNQRYLLLFFKTINFHKILHNFYKIQMNAYDFLSYFIHYDHYLFFLTIIMINQHHFLLWFQTISRIYDNTYTFLYLILSMFILFCTKLNYKLVAQMTEKVNIYM